MLLRFHGGTKKMSSVIRNKGRMWGILAGALMVTAMAMPVQAQEKTPNAKVVEQVNINEADAKTLADVLVGVGDSKAKAIVEFREQHGPFTSIEQLIDVNGIGDAILSQNRERITLE